MKKNQMSSIDHRKFKDEVYGELARIGAALANSKRLLLLELLAQRERSVEDLAIEMDISIASASQHLRALADARLVRTERKGTFVFYSLSGESVYRLVASLRDVAQQQLAELPAIMQRHLGDLRGPSDIVTVAEIEDVFERDRSLLVDVRPAEEYRFAHLTGARSVPITELPREIRRRRFPRDREIVVYCRGPFCIWADQAVAVLQKQGYRARRLQLGVRDYEALGVNVERDGAVN